MKKGYLVGGLAIIGAIALIAYFKPKGKKTDKFVSASGGMSSGGSLSRVRSTCKKCKDSETGGTYQNWNGICDSGDTCVQKG
jgi:hypothetical protein